MKVLRSAIAIGLLLCLTACGGEPSDSEVKDAFFKSLRGNIFALSLLNPQADHINIIGPNADKEIDDAIAVAAKNTKIDVGDKNKQADGTYIAIVTISANGTSKTSTLHLIKGSDGWSTLAR